MNKMIMNRLTMLAVTLMASMACFAQGKFDKGLVTSIGTGKALYDIFDYQELRYRILNENWVDEPRGLEGYEVEIIGFASYISGADGTPDYISNSSIDNEVGYDNKIIIGHVITKEVAGVDVHVIAVAPNAFTSTTCYNDDAANKSKFAEAAAKVKTIKFDFNPGKNDKFVDLSVPTIGANAFKGLTALESVNNFAPAPSTSDADVLFATDVYEYVDFNLLYSETAGVPKAFSKIPGWRKFRFRYVGGKLMGDFPSYDGEILSSEITKMRNKVLDYMDDEDEYDEFYDFDGNGALTGADVTFLRIISLNQYDR